MLTGKALTGKNHYYMVHVLKPIYLEDSYYAECGDIIEALGLTFNEGEVFKAIWRNARDRQGVGKQGTPPLYNAEKIAHYGSRVLVQEQVWQMKTASEMKENQVRADGSVSGSTVGYSGYAQTVSQPQPATGPEPAPSPFRRIAIHNVLGKWCWLEREYHEDFLRQLDARNPAEPFVYRDHSGNTYTITKWAYEDENWQYV